MNIYVGILHLCVVVFTLIILPTSKYPFDSLFYFLLNNYVKKRDLDTFFDLSMVTFKKKSKTLL